MQPAVSLAELLTKSTKHLRPCVIDAINRSTEIAVFGSSACGLRTSHSDLDIFCVSTRTFHLSTDAVDLIFFSEHDLYEETWLGSELASHVNAYGVWLRGNPSWADAVSLSPNALAKKRRRLSSYSSALSDRWDKLSVMFKQKYVTKLRREVQRLQLLEQDIPIPPTRLLDKEWHLDQNKGTQIIDELSGLFRARKTAFYEDFERLIRLDWQSKRRVN
jgi:predicted nucleotidyltransferase